MKKVHDLLDLTLLIEGDFFVRNKKEDHSSVEYRKATPLKAFFLRKMLGYISQIFFFGRIFFHLNEHFCNSPTTYRN